jgi:hypothetical protein
MAIIRPVRTSMSFQPYPPIGRDAALQPLGPQLMLRNTSMASSTTPQLALAENDSNEEPLPVAGHNTFIPTISNRVTTLSTTRSTESDDEGRTEDWRPELDVTQIEGGHSTN